MKLRKSIISRLTVALVIAVIAAMQAWSGNVKDLPTIRSNGKIMYYYDAQPGDNIYSIADKVGVSVEDIRRYNPSVSDGVKPRMRLFFPSDIATDETGDSAGPLTHIVGSGESVYGIANRYGMTVDELYDLNPQLRDNTLKKGMRLRLNAQAASASAAEILAASSEKPAAVYEKPADEPSADQLIAESLDDATPASDGPATDPAATYAPAADEPATTADEDFDLPERREPIAEPTDTMKVAIILPFMLHEQEMGRQTKLYTEFYKGFLMAADTLNRPGRTPVRLFAYDSCNNLDTLSRVMARDEIASMDLIVAPDNPAQLSMIASKAPRNAWVLNIFSVKDSSYLDQPGMIQTNIPHEMMYDRAIEGFLNRYPDTTPVFLSRTGGKADKEQFTAGLKEALSRRGIIYRTIIFSDFLSEDDLADYDTNTGRFVFIPASGNREEFSRIQPGLKAFRQAALDPSAVQLFGYPEWATFRGSQSDELCELETTIYSRYFPLENDPEAKELSDRFYSLYGEKLTDKQIPVFGILGYDTGIMVIDGLRAMARTDFFPSEFSGIQSGLRLRQAPGENGGLYNDALFIITYKPGGELEKILQ